MEPGQVLVGLLYLWLLAALVYYGWRLYRRITRDESPPGREAPGPAPADAPRPVPGTAMAPAGDRPPLAELVQGIVLPCDLTPLVTADDDPHRAVFTTTGQQPGRVATAVGDELARLGFALERVDDIESIATREGARVHLQVHPDGPATRALFPRAPERSVVTELTN